jgi:hypothetical protein
MDVPRQSSDSAMPVLHRHPGRAAFVALLVGLLAVHVVLLWLMLGRHLDFAFNASKHRLGPGTDFAAYWVAAKQWQAGEGMFGHGPGFGYRYHPLFILTIGQLLASLKMATAHHVWIAINEVLLFIGLLYLRRLLPDWRHFIAAAGLLAIWSPYYLEVYMGNSTFVVTMLSLMAFYHYRRGQRAAFLALLTAGILIKPPPLVFLPILLVRKQWTSIGIVLAAIIVTAAPYFVLHPDQWAIFRRINTEAVPLAGFAIHAGTQGLHGLVVTLCTRLSGVPTAELASYSQLPAGCQVLIRLWPLLFIVPSFLATWRLRNQPDAAVFLWTATYILGYKDVWEHSYTFLIAGLVYLWLSGRVNRVLFLICAIAVALPTAFALYDDTTLPPGPYDPEHSWPLAIAILHHATKPIWVLILWLACLLQAFRRQALTA